MKYQLLNGKAFSSEKTPIHSSNRSFSYGDGFFESIKVSNGKAPFAKLHWQRLVAACNILQISIPSGLDETKFVKEIERLARINDEPNSRVRFQGFRVGPGKYTPASSVLGWLMVSHPTDFSEFRLNKKGFTVGICDTHTINPAPQSSFKSSNALPYVLGGMFAQKHGFEDCLLLDSKGKITETTSSNVFLVKNEKLITPSLANGGVAGVMRHLVIQEASFLNLGIEMKDLSIKDVLNADECFLTNATSGIQWVGAFETKRFFKRNAVQLVEHINHKFRLVS